MSGVLVALTVPTGTARAQVPPSDTESWGDLIGDGAEVGAFEQSSVPSSSPGGGSQGNPITCTLTRVTGGIGVPVTRAQLEAEYEATGQQPVSVARTCMQGGQLVIDDIIDWTPTVGDPVDPAWLAERARERLNLPSPAAEMAPPPGVGTTAQLPAYFWLTNWPVEPLWEEASAGSVTARVTATPLRQTWRVNDELRGEATTNNCGATPGVAFDPANPVAAGTCSWVPRHSSAGQSSRDPQTGEPCFDTSVTVYWALSWDSNITAPEDMGVVPMTSVACIVVHEIQAVVSGS